MTEEDTGALTSGLGMSVCIYIQHTYTYTYNMCRYIQHKRIKKELSLTPGMLAHVTAAFGGCGRKIPSLRLDWAV